MVEEDEGDRNLILHEGPHPEDLSEEERQQRVRNHFNLQRGNDWISNEFLMGMLCIYLVFRSVVLYNRRVIHMNHQFYVVGKVS